MSELSHRQQTCPPDLLQIVKALLAADGFVSGSDLARDLGVSRPAIHGKLTKLRREGFRLEAVRNRGYRLVELPAVLHPALLHCELERLGSSIRTVYFPAIDSTNDEAERRVASGVPGPFAVVSSCQTQGRGRLGREWHSASAENLYLSVLFEPNIAPHRLQHFTLWAGIFICRTLRGLMPGAPLEIKWPNDLQCKGRKFAGMLTEARIDADAVRSIIFGVGLNVNSNPQAYPPGIRKSATSLLAVHGEPLPLSRLAAEIIQAVEKAYAHCIGGASAERLSEAWAPLDALEGKPVTAVGNGIELSGLACGIDESGGLMIEKADGSRQVVRAGDVTLKK